MKEYLLFALVFFATLGLIRNITLNKGNIGCLQWGIYFLSCFIFCCYQSLLFRHLSRLIKIEKMFVLNELLDCFGGIVSALK